MSADAPRPVPSTDDRGEIPPTQLPTNPQVTPAPPITEAFPPTLACIPSVSTGVAASAPTGYEILDELGRGGMGVVYKARHVHLERIVALKMILSADHASSAEVARFQIEARAVARLQHPGIVQVFEVGEHAGRPFLSLEFCDGGALAGKLNGDPWPARQAAETIEALASAMQHAHENGIVHRDLKPANVLLTRDGHLKVTDFGLAKRTDSDSDLSRSGAIMGTPSYMAPEQAMGKIKEVGPAADVWALGTVLYELLTGRVPFKGVTALDTLAQVASEDPVPPSRLARVPRDLETICVKCLEKDIRKRYGSAAALADDLKRFLAGEPIVARPAGRFERAVKWARRRPALAALLLVSVLGVAGIVAKYVDAEQQRDEALQAKRSALAAAERAELEKERANKAEKTARGEAERANGEAAKANRERERAEGFLYAANVRQARSFWETGDMAAAHEWLDACRWDYRRWEHGHLRRQLDATCVTLNGNTTGVTRVTFSPDGRKLACTTSLGAVRLYDVATVEHLLSLKELSGCMAFSPDGTRLVTGGLNGTIKIWDASGDRELLAFKGHSALLGGVRGIIFSQDGSRLATWSLDRTMKIWDAATGQELVLIKNPTASAAFSPDGTRLASTSADRSVKLWDTQTGREVLALKGHTGEVLSVSFSPDGRHLASGSADRTVRLWDPRTGQIKIILKGHAGSVSEVCFSPDGKRLASAGADRTAKVWDALTGQELLNLQGHTNGVENLAFSPDGKCLASTDGTVRLWDAVNGRKGLTFQGHTKLVACVAFSPDGKRLASGSEDKTVKLWDAATGQEVRSFSGHTGSVLGVCFSPNGKRLASASEDRTVKVWAVTSGKEECTLLVHNTDFVWSVAFSPDGTRLATGSGDGTVSWWDASNGRELMVRARHDAGVISVAFSADGKRMASGSRDRRVKLWDAITGDELCTLSGHTDTISSVAFSADSKRLGSGSRDRTVKVWDPTSGQELLTLKGHTADVTGIAFSPDGSRLLSGSQDRTVKVWDAVSGQELLSLKGHGSDVTGVAVSPDGKLVASSSEDRTVKLWESEAGQELFVLNGHTTQVARVSFSADGTRVVSLEAKGTVRSWNAVTGQPIVPCPDPSSAVGIRALSPDGKLFATADGASINVVRTTDKRPRSSLVFLDRLNEPVSRRLWHAAAADGAESEGEWFAAAHHLTHLHQLADAADNLVALHVRLLRARTLEHAVDAKPLLANARQPAERATAEERALADVYFYLDVRPFAVQWWLGSDVHATVLGHLRAAEERHLLQPVRP